MIRNISLLLASVLLLAVLGEGMVRILGGEEGRRSDHLPQGFFCVQDPLLGWAGRPGFRGVARFHQSDMNMMRIQLNENGFWDRSHTTEKPSNTQRLLFLGDSFTIGYGVREHERFTSRIEAMLPAGVESINMGMWGYSTDQELILLQETGLKYDPDVVVVGLFLDDLFCSNLLSVNDGLYPKPKYMLGDSGGLRLSNVPVYNNRGPSEFWNFILTRWFKLRNRLEVGSTFAKIGWFSVFDRGFVSRRGFTASLLLLGRMHAICTEKGISLLVVIIPYVDQLAAAEIHATELSYYGIHPKRLDMFLPQKVIRAYCRERDLPLLDLLPVFKKQQRPRELFFERDLHWTPRGHRVAAEAILRKLRELGWLGPDARKTSPQAKHTLESG